MTAIDIGGALRLMRVEAGFSLRELARRVGVSGAYLSRVEHGHDRAPTPDRLIGIAQALGVPPALLLELTRELPPAAVAYLRETPGAVALLMELVHRRPGPAQLARLRSQLVEVAPGGSPAEDAVQRWGPLLSPARVVTRFAGRAMEDLLDVAAARLAAGQPEGTARAVAGALRAQEALALSWLGAGMAVPHAAQAGLPLRAALVTLARPLVLPGTAPDGVRIALILAGSARPLAMVGLLLQAARLASYGIAGQLHACQDAREALERLEAMEATLG